MKEKAGSLFASTLLSLSSLRSSSMNLMRAGSSFIRANDSIRWKYLSIQPWVRRTPSQVKPRQTERSAMMPWPSGLSPSPCLCQASCPRLSRGDRDTPHFHTRPTPSSASPAATVRHKHHTVIDSSITIRRHWLIQSTERDHNQYY